MAWSSSNTQKSILSGYAHELWRDWAGRWALPSLPKGVGPRLVRGRSNLAFVPEILEGVGWHIQGRGIYLGAAGVEVGERGIVWPQGIKRKHELDQFRCRSQRNPVSSSNLDVDRENHGISTGTLRVEEVSGPMTPSLDTSRPARTLEVAEVSPGGARCPLLDMGGVQVPANTCVVGKRPRTEVYQLPHEESPTLC